MIIQDLEYLEVVPDSEVSKGVLGGRGSSRQSRVGQNTITPISGPGITGMMYYMTNSSYSPFLGGTVSTTGGMNINVTGRSFAYVTAGISGGIAMGPLGLATSPTSGYTAMAY